ncbi:MobV family relaxase [Exiguobacterium sp. CH10]|uniref:MobV family relaxase n=1 Tax=Exiguobacterium sp. CH10 TaxID=2751261 RepID=UPI001BE75444|nr:MobV family relaxase [Exiguobacterium sp. CH10]
MAFEFAWNAQKNQISDVKGKEREQEREGRINNKMIDSSRTHLNYDFVDSEVGLYRRVKERSDYLKSQGSKVQKNSVVLYSNIITIPKEEAVKMTDEEHKRYFKSCYEYFCDRYGTENVMSAKVHLDETTPHMHLHFMPVNKENGKLQARIVMGPKALREIHDQLPKFLQERGFDVQRASGNKTKMKLDIHEFKAHQDFKRQTELLREEVEALSKKADQRKEYVLKAKDVRDQLDEQVVEYEKLLGKQKKQVEVGQKRLDSLYAELETTEDFVSKEVESLKGQADQYRSQIQDTIDALSDLRLVESFGESVKRQKLSSNLTISPSSFENLKKQAELSVQLQKALQTSERDRKRLEDRNKYLESQNDRIPKLLQENRRLTKEIEFFKSLLTKLKDALVNQKMVAQDKLDEWIGSFKSRTAFEMNGSIDPKLENEKEKEGFEWHRKQFGAKYEEKSSDMER